VKTTVAVLLFLVLTGWGIPAGERGEGGAFPEVAGWHITPPPGDSIYTPDNLWDIIDVGAELFLSYGFKDLRIAEYTDTAGTDVRVELYRHSTVDNAFGIYSQERNPGYHFIRIGVQGYLEEKVLNFLCGAYYVKISSHREGSKGLEAMQLIGSRVAEHLRQKPEWPATLAQLPAEGRLANTEGYIADNFLGYRCFRSAFTARYEGGCTLFVMDFGSPAGVRGALEEYAKGAKIDVEFHEGVITGVVDPHNGHVSFIILGKTLCGAFGSGGTDVVRRYAEALRANVRRREGNGN
jgi:hypothetical protein